MTSTQETITFDIDITDIDAVGEILLKCDNYTFSTQTCEDDNWHTFKTELVPGQPYSFTLLPGDPGFSEINGTAADDAYYRSGAPNNNYGASTRIRVGRGGSGNYIRGIIKFDLSSIPDDAVILDANLSLYFYNIRSGDDTGNRTHGVYRVQQNPNRNWSELEVTWNNYTSSQQWTTAGGDFNATATDTVTFDSSALNSWIKFSVTSDVQNFVNNKSENFGWVIKDTTEDSTYIRRDYHSSEHSNASLQPKLEILWDLKPNVTLVSPANGTTTTNNYVNFICNASDNEQLVNLTLYVWNSTNLYYNNTKIISGTSNQSNWNLTNMANDNYTWNCLAYDNASLSNWANENWTVTVNYIPDNPPKLNLAIKGIDIAPIPLNSCTSKAKGAKFICPSTDIEYFFVLAQAFVPQKILAALPEVLKQVSPSTFGFV